MVAKQAHHIAIPSELPADRACRIADLPSCAKDAISEVAMSCEAPDPLHALAIYNFGGNTTADQTWRLRKHADYQKTYKASRKQFSPSMAYFHAPQPDGAHLGRARVGLTAGRVLGNAVERNRIKRRMREAIRSNLHLLPSKVDVILHPRRTVLAMGYAELRLEVQRIFSKIQGSKVQNGRTPDDKTQPGSRPPKQINPADPGKRNSGHIVVAASGRPE